MKFRGRERRAKGRVRLHMARGSAELSEVASGSATQSLWLRNGKVRSQGLIWVKEKSKSFAMPQPSPLR